MEILVLFVTIACLFVIALIPEAQARLLPPPIQLVRMGVRLLLKTIVVLSGCWLGYTGFKTASNYYVERKEAEKYKLEVDSMVVNASYTETVEDTLKQPSEIDINKFKKAEKRIMFGSWSLKDESDFLNNSGVYTFKKDGSFYKDDGSTGSWELDIRGNFIDRSKCSYTLYIHEVDKSKQYLIHYFNEKSLSGKVDDFHNFTLIKRLNIEPEPNTQATYQPTLSSNSIE